MCSFTTSVRIGHSNLILKIRFEQDVALKGVDLRLAFDCMYESLNSFKAIIRGTKISVGLVKEEDVSVQSSPSLSIYI